MEMNFMTNLNDFKERIKNNTLNNPLYNLTILISELIATHIANNARAHTEIMKDEVLSK
jgi:hypothetical protein